MSEPQVNFHLDSFPIKFTEISSEGFLTFIAPVAKTGKMLYFDQETKAIYEENVPEKVLLDSAKTFRTKPITHPHHPKEKITSKNYKKYVGDIKGVTGNKEYFQKDTGLLWFSGSVFDEETIAAIKTGETKEISCGYDGYTIAHTKDSREQVKRVGNHLTICAKGRAGRDVSFIVDSEDSETHNDLSIWVMKNDQEIVIPDAPEEIIKLLGSMSNKIYFDMNSLPTEKPRKNKKMAKSILIGTEVFNLDEDSAPGLTEAIKTLQSQVETLLTEAATAKAGQAEVQTKLDAVSTELATVKGQLTVKEQELTEVKTKMDSQGDLTGEIKLRLDTWNAVESFIKKVNPNFKRDEHLGLSPIEIKRMYLGYRFPQLKTNLDAYDLSDPIKVAEINGMYMTSVTSQDTVNTTTHTDSMLETLRTSESRGTTHNDSGGLELVDLGSDPLKVSHEDAATNLEILRAQLRKKIETNGKKK